MGQTTLGESLVRLNRLNMDRRSQSVLEILEMLR